MLKSVISKLEEAETRAGEGTPLAVLDLIGEAIQTLKTLVHESETKHAHWHPRIKTIAVDFDGVIHSYQTPWQGPAVIPDPPLPGAIGWLENMVLQFKVLIFSARCNDLVGIASMKLWLINHGLKPSTLNKIIFEPGKPSAHVFIDDRALQFTGAFPVNADLRNFKPWYYGKPGWNR
jgi:hypothetical protein